MNRGGARKDVLLECDCNGTRFNAEKPLGKYSKYHKRKEKFSPEHEKGRCVTGHPSGRRTFFPAPSLKASLTVEASLVLPLFFLVMIAIACLMNGYSASVRFSSAMSETAEEMAIAAYATEYGEEPTLLGAALSVAFAHGRVMSRADDRGATTGENFIHSEFMEIDDMIDLIMTYRMKLPAVSFKLPGTWYVQEAAVRAWTGRKGSGGTKPSDSGEEDDATVYVTDYGEVYHTDSNCSHIRLNISSTDSTSVDNLRNVYGEKYHRCEKCGGGSGTVFITTDGDRYHSSLGCSGLTRTAKTYTKKEAEQKYRPCSKCAAQHGHS